MNLTPEDIVIAAARLARCSSPSDSGCLIWNKGKNDYGYGSMRVNGRTRGAHRIAWVCARGPIPEGLCVLHKCDVRACVNPEHLFLGSRAENIADMTAKDRQAKGERSGASLHPESYPRGERHWNARLTAETVCEARKLNEQGISLSELARRFGVGLTTMHWAVMGVTWKHVAFP